MDELNTHLWVAMFVEIANTINCKPRTIGIFKTKLQAERAVYEDMNEYLLLYGNQMNTVDVNFEKMYAITSDCQCEWNVEQTKIC